MTNEQINAAIAEACGFIGWDEFYVNKDGPKFRFWDYPKDWNGPSREPWVPLFCTDLNAIHEAEKTLTIQQKENDYQILLETVTRSGKSGLTFGLAAYLFCHATAHQRAEAFLRTLGKWEEGE
jgi:hypothetical protein